MIPQNLGLLFKETAEKFPTKAALMFKVGSLYTSMSWQEAYETACGIAAGFLDEGVRPGDRIAILSENRPEWALVDLAAQMIGVATVPIYTSLTPHEIRYLLKDSGSRLVAVSNRKFMEKLQPIQAELPDLKAVIALDASLAGMAGQIGIPIRLLKEITKKDLKPAIESRLAEVSSDATASIIYTSGTTGPPKGVMLSHSNFIHNVVYSSAALKMGPTDLHLSFLPLSHVFERMAGHYLMIYIGATIAYAEDMDSVPKDLLEIKPTFILGVPRFYEKIQARVLEAVEKAGPLRKGLFFWARDLGKARRLAKKPAGFFMRLKSAFAKTLVYHKFRSRLGGRVRFCISGGAPLSKDLAEFFFDLGVLIYEGYGLTETSPVISVNREGNFKFGTVGIPLREVEVRIADDGEILTRSACVMKGYFNKPEETRSVLKEGWFYTGDFGRLDPEGFLTITGRKKELIVTSGGKKVSPQIIEDLLTRDPYLLRAVLFGEGKKFLTALVIPVKEKLEEHARDQKIAFTRYDELLRDKMIYQFLDGRIQALMTDFASYEKIKYFALLEHDFTQEAGELTPTLKIKRDVILSRHQEKLLPFYQDAG